MSQYLIVLAFEFTVELNYGFVYLVGEDCIHAEQYDLFFGIVYTVFIFFMLIDLTLPILFMIHHIFIIFFIIYR